MLTSEWWKSSRSGNTGGACVEARTHGGLIQVRDTKLGAASRFWMSPRRVGCAPQTRRALNSQALARQISDGLRLSGGRSAFGQPQSGRYALQFTSVLAVEGSFTSAAMPDSTSIAISRSPA
ncbi:hypothetical protein GCM10029992_00030 [Glycomyces albus]